MRSYFESSVRMYTDVERTLLPHEPPKYVDVSCETHSCTYTDQVSGMGCTVSLPPDGALEVFAWRCPDFHVFLIKSTDSEYLVKTDFGTIARVHQDKLVQLLGHIERTHLWLVYAVAIAPGLILRARIRDLCRFCLFGFGRASKTLP